MNATPISEKKPLSPAGRIGLTLLGVALIAGGLSGFWFITLSPLINVVRSGSWPAADCTITSSILERHEDDDGTSWSAEISFQYQVDNQTIISNTYSFYNVSGSRESALKIVDSHPVGKQTRCVYDPREPERAVIDRGFHWWSLLGALFLIMPLIGGIIFLNAVGGSRPFTGKQRSSLTPGIGSNKSYSDLFSSEWEGPQRLKPEASRLGRVIGVSLVALFWNGIVGAVGYAAFFGNGGGLDFCVTLFLIPFAVVGLLLVGGVVHQLLAMTNPIVEIALSNGTVMPGDTIEVAWETKGRTSRLRKLFIAIDGSEQARYTRGTDTYTDHESFCLIVVADITDPQNMRFGSQSVQIPEDAIPTFDAPNNKIIWSIKIIGDIPRWPDVGEEFAFRVKPS